ncbi:hypothetical protein L484_014812 [Morus notabilis]|uniref:Ubiquitin-like domain-containing protein n=1 Tax=Morus notabilis TaxID=981085 RepID=W9QEN9_9ROSA|nr:ubiquitin domain-containing protein 7SL RNA1 [Morus notabilis]EXB31385.1 hypothetical protein L484_014812 [Morus notabilis]
MDLIFNPKKRPPFTIEVGYFDTVEEIKQKVEKYQGVPVSDQTLIFNGHVLPDDGDIASCVLLHNSHINLIIASDEKPVFLRVKIPTPQPHIINIEMDMDDTPLKLRNNILTLEMANLPANRPLVLSLDGQELQDDRTFEEYEVSNGTEIDVRFRTPILMVIVQSMCETMKIPVEVNPEDDLAELRKDCERLKEKMNFPLPEEGYFFIHRQAVMDEEMSFRWHNVEEADTIEVFAGRILPPQS